MILLLILGTTYLTVNSGQTIRNSNRFLTNFVNSNIDSFENESSGNARNVRQLITGTVPNIVTPGTTCICVPPGSCFNSGSTDGSGQIDIRIVTNPGLFPTSPPPQACSYGLVQCCQPGSYRCGVRYPSPPNSIAPLPGQAAFGSYPWQAAILTLSDVYLGSGALIDNRHVLTAAHKVNNIPSNSIKIRLGEWDASTTTEPIPAQDIQILRIFIHPNFNASNLFNDVAVLRLSVPIALGSVPTISTVCLTAETFIGSICFVSGWGKNDFGQSGSFQAIQKQVDVLVKGQPQCQNELRATRLGPSFVLDTTSFTCAGGENGKDACTGDGGSPLVCQRNNQWYVVGLVAWGIGCAVAGIPGVYVRVASYIPWIQSAINTI